ncbi:hypothetical protein M378DRAFT_17185 [Amanita muscaria Koide BX008]|uniref:Uncharacterized protein n=1 Tax=Amanita muscaria (strain Koide BX008) TaxID=946122 RepID=A0A0C2SQQ6_AMAMK|nr:hypothetical protein M378DRAFT_17185 [Amanita muscaria Koide BX008]
MLEIGRNNVPHIFLSATPLPTVSAPPAILPVPPIISLPTVSLPRAQSAPLPSSTSAKTSLPPHAHTAPPEVSKNTLTARRCTTQDASPTLFVKFMDVPTTFSREDFSRCLKDNRKWSTVDISNMEIFAMKNKDSTVTNVLKVKFKDDAHSMYHGQKNTHYEYIFQ